MLRRVKLENAADLDSALPAAGYRADRLSVWFLETEALEASDQLAQVAVQAADLAARGSRVLGTLPDSLTERGMENVMAGVGLLMDGVPSAPGVFIASQLRLSAVEQDVYERHAAAADETDEDFFDNFS